jgi:alpha-beta hydrolase superfamily lysophospholipase
LDNDSGTYFDIVPREPRAALVIVHGLAEHAERHRHCANALAGFGIASHVYDQRGHGRAPGERTHIDRFDDFVADLHAVLARVQAKYPSLPLFLWGHSMGALIATLAAASPPVTLRGCITTSHPLNSFDGRGLQMALARPLSRFAPRRRFPLQLDPAGLSHELEVQRAYATDPLVPKTASVRLLVEMAKACAACRKSLPDIRQPWLALHGDADPIVPVAGSRLLIERLGSQDKKLIVLPGLRHEIQNETPPAPADLFRTMAEWTTARL